ncbi:Dimer-Tnp-hAT domain containing protein [Pyrenophora tritici-repentis]|nr:Dimer-Tnp-hAT domain containing protein [Pyrenophora tritici-repentis]
MALTILSIPASSCECERVFSELGDLLEPRRRCISPELLAALHSVRRWRRAGFGGGDNDDMGQSKLTDEQMDVLYELSQSVVLELLEEYDISGDQIGYFMLDNASANDTAVEFILKDLCL